MLFVTIFLNTLCPEDGRLSFEQMHAGMAGGAPACELKGPSSIQIPVAYVNCIFAPNDNTGLLCSYT